MRKLSWGLVWVAFSLLTQNLLAASLPLSFHLANETVPAALTVKDYEMKETSDHQLAISLKPEDAKVLGRLTAENLGRTLILKQGERVLASPTIKAAIQGQDFVVSMK